MNGVINQQTVATASSVIEINSYHIAKALVEYLKKHGYFFTEPFHKYKVSVRKNYACDEHQLTLVLGMTKEGTDFPIVYVTEKT